MVKGRDWSKLAGPAIALFIALLGFTGSWYTVRANVTELEDQQQEAKSDIKDNSKAIIELKVKGALDNQSIQHIVKTLEEIKVQTSKIPDIQSELKTLRRRNQ